MPKKCSFEGCPIKYALFSDNKESKKRYCFNHKLEGMINVKNLKCKHQRRKSECKECGGSSFCEHSRQKSTCKECGGSSICKHQRKKSRCKECGGSSLCKSTWCETRGNKKYEGYCLVCFIHLFPDKPVVKNYKTKEKTVVDFVKTEFKQFDWIYNKRIQDGCSSRMPDLLLDLGYQVLIVEIDENQHQAYDCTCENKRLMQISQDTGHRPVVFIRFNPDEYIDEKENKISGCFGLGKDGILRIKKTKQKEWENRLNILKEQIQYWVDNKTNKTVEVIQLFFNSLNQSK